VIFDVTLFDELLRAPREIGARAVIRNNRIDIEEVPSSERGVIVDIATADDYAREILRRGGRKGE
jgi:CTP:molybdopterin cytidylyltransferase MocA